MLPTEELESAVRNDVVPPTLGSSIKKSVVSNTSSWQSVTVKARGKSVALNVSEVSVLGPMQKKSTKKSTTTGRQHEYRRQSIRVRYYNGDRWLGRVNLSGCIARFGKYCRVPNQKERAYAQ